MPRKIDLTGQRFGRLQVILQVPRPPDARDTRARWLCKCDCGNFSHKDSANLRNGISRSCGCLQIDLTISRQTTHGCSPADWTKHTPEYRCWQNMIARCVNPNRRDYKHYGGRGISVCERWRKFEAFLEDMGIKPDPSLTLDRINVNGHYEPSNCRWATWSEQQCNKRQAKHI
jgi:hypothetical protein